MRRMTGIYRFRFAGEMVAAPLKAPSDEGAVSEADWGREIVANTVFFSPSVNCLKSAIDSSLVRGSLLNCPINRNFLK